MRHAKKRLQLNRYTSWRKSTLTNMVKNLLVKERVITTKIKAKASAPLMEKLIHLGKHPSLANRRRSYKVLGDHRLVSLLFNEISPRFFRHNSGYVRIVPWGLRRGDGAEMVVLELTQRKEKVAAPKKKKPQAPVEEEMPAREKPKVTLEEKRPPDKKPKKKFLGGLRQIFKKERDSL